MKTQGVRVASQSQSGRGILAGLVLGVMGWTLCGCRSASELTIDNVASEEIMIETVPASSAPQAQVPLVATALVYSAMQHNAELLGLREAMDVARAEAVTVTGLRNPELRVEYSEGSQVTERSWYGNSAPQGTPPNWVPYPSVSDRTAGSVGTRYTLRLYPPNPWLMKIQGGAARARFAAALADVQAAEWRLECGIERSLAEIAGLQRELDILRKQVALRRDNRVAVQALVRQHQATALDELEADQRQMRAEDDIASVEQTLQDRYAELSGLVGAPVQEMVVAAEGAGSEVTASIPPEIVREYRGRLAEIRAEVMAAYWRHQESLSRCREARVEQNAWFTYVEGSYANSDSSDHLDAEGWSSPTDNQAAPPREISADKAEDEEWSIEAGIAIPIFAYHEGATRIQKANVKRYAVALRESLRKAQSEFDMAYQGWLAAVSRAEAAQEEMVRRQSKADELARKLDESSGVGPEARLKLEEMTLQLQRVKIRASREKARAWWRFQETAGGRLNE